MSSSVWYLIWDDSDNFFPFPFYWNHCYSFCLLPYFQMLSFYFWCYFFFSLSLRCNVPHSLDFFFFKVHFSLLLPKSSQVTNIRYLRFSRVLPQILLLTGLEVSITHLLSWSCWCTPGLLLYCSLQWPPTSGFRFLLLKACLLHCNITAV